MIYYRKSTPSLWLIIFKTCKIFKIHAKLPPNNLINFIMSNGSLSIEKIHYNDSRNKNPFMKEWFEYQPYVKGNNITEAVGISEEEMREINGVLGTVFEKVQDASFVSQGVINAVPGHDVYIDFKGRGTLFPLRPRATTLSPQRLAATLYNSSGEAARDIVNLIGDAEIVKKADRIKRDETDKVGSRETLEFVSDHNDEDIFRNIELLNKEARELLALYGDDIVDAVRDLVQNIARSMLVRAELSYESLLDDIYELSQGVDAGEISEDTKYSTLHPEDLVKMMYRAFEFAIPGLLMRLPDGTRNDIISLIQIKEAGA